MKKLTSIVAGLIISILPSCDSPLPLTPSAYVPPNPIIDSPIKTSMKTYYGTINYRGRKVVELLEDKFTQGLVINIGKRKKESRYIIANLLKENESRTLIIGSFIGLNSEIEKKVEKALSINDYKSAREILSQSNFFLIEYHDSKIDGLKLSEKNDFIIIKNKQGKITKTKISEQPDLLRRRNETYLSLLNQIYFLRN
jgi:hypothetical protein